MALKGHTVIELTDVNTGEVQKVEHDNMVTNGLKVFFTPFGGSSCPGIGAQIIENILGGVFLFRDNLDEDPDNLSIPTNNKLVGKASNTFYNGSDALRGSYNTEESGPSDDGSYKMVWDFGTNQANGQISAVSLTTKEGGQLAGGFDSYTSDRAYLFATYILCNPRDGALMNYFEPFIDVEKSELYYNSSVYSLYYNDSNKYEHIGLNKKIYLKKRKVPCLKVSPLYIRTALYSRIEDAVIDIPDDFAEYVQGKHCMTRNSDNYIYIFPFISPKQGETFKILQIRKKDFYAKTISLINNTGRNLDQLGNRMAFTDEFMIVTSTSGNSHFFDRFNLLTNEVVSVNNPVGSTNFQASIIDGWMYSANTMYNLNVETMEFKYNYQWYSASNIEYAQKICPGFHVFYAASSTNNVTFDIISVWDYRTLMTINNLYTPVTKTPSQTMKVIYTLQDTDE